MTLRDKVGQLFILGFEGTTPTPAFRKLIREARIGGVVLFSRNFESPTQLIRLINGLQRLSPDAPLFVAVDHEGGRVSRLPAPFTFFPAAAQVGAGNSHRLAYAMGQAMARELKAVGINLNFAPVLDVHTNARNRVIGDRAFGKDAIQVAKMALAVMVGLQDHGVIACGKHFPGHGDTTADSHRELPRVKHSLSRLIEVELRPFAHAIQNRIEALMTAHVVYHCLDPDRPATLSRTVLTRLLRQAMGFLGVVITDDLEMKAISDRWRIRDAAVDALRAGADLLLLCRDPGAQEEAHAAVRDAAGHALTEKRIEQALNRVLRLKERYLLPHKPANVSSAQNWLGREEHRALAKELARA